MKRAEKPRKPSEPADWQEGQEAAREARETVAQQAAELLRERDMTGSEQDLVRRLREMGEARLSGDSRVYRSAAMEAAVSLLALIADVDLRPAR